jgi:hypothetical protein
MLFAAVVLKFVPVMVTEVPMGPEVGENEVIVGTAAVAVVVKLTIDPLDVPALFCPTTR